MAPPPKAAEIPLVGLMLLDGFPEGLENDAMTILDEAGVVLAVDRRENVPFAGLELYLPTAAAVFVAGAFFTGFVTKAGEDAYDALKRAAMDIWRKTRGARVTAIGTAGKVSSERKFTLNYSIIGQYAPGLTFKLLLQSEVTEEEVEAGTDSFLRLIDDLLHDRVSEGDCVALLTYKPVTGTVLVTYDAKGKKIVPVDGLEGVGR